MEKNKAKAFLAIIIALVFILTAYVMFFNNSLTEPQRAAIITPPPEQPTAPPPQPEDDSGTGVYGGGSTSKQDSGGGGGGSTPTSPEEPILVNTFRGYWGLLNTPDPLSSATGSLYADSISQTGELVNPTIVISATFEDHSIYFRFPVTTPFQGVNSSEANFGQSYPISGSAWQETKEPGHFIALFTMDNVDYWIYGMYNGHELPKTSQQPWFVGFWGACTRATPTGTLKGQVVSIAVTETGNLAKPWLNLIGPYQDRQVTIRFPLENHVFDGYLILPANAVDVKSTLISGSFWHENDGTGFFITFFSWSGNNYWILGEGQDL